MIAEVSTGFRVFEPRVRRFHSHPRCFRPPVRPSPRVQGSPSSGSPVSDSTNTRSMNSIANGCFSSSFARKEQYPITPWRRRERHRVAQVPLAPVEHGKPHEEPVGPDHAVVLLDETNELVRLVRVRHGNDEIDGARLQPLAASPDLRRRGPSRARETPRRKGACRRSPAVPRR